VNSGNEAVPGPPLVFEMPAGARNTTVLEGSSQQATAAGSRVAVSGPFQSGSTVVQFAYEVPYANRELRLALTFPSQLQQVSVIAEKVGDMHISSAEFSSHGEMPSDGRNFIVANGPELPAGRPLRLHITGLPKRSTWPRVLALAIAAVIVSAGAWLAVRRTPDAEEITRRELESQREQLFADLVAVEKLHRTGDIAEPQYTLRKQRLIAHLERLYAQLDHGVAA
jgi:hypothetical protein